MRFARNLLIGGAALLGAATAGAQEDAGARARDVAGARPRVELVFVLDTTGSMGGLIEAAKQKVWGIVNEVMKAPGKPEVRMGLVAYRDRGDAYVTQVLPITRDLDKVYTTLMGYRADGGGDGPEDVRRALADGVRKAGWSPRSPDVARILFLVGDAPPHDDYADEPDTVATASEAARAGMIVNAIQCGNMPDTGDAWRKICRAGEGQFFAIAQDGGVVAVSTPFDAELADLGTKVGGTYLAFGGGVAADPGMMGMSGMSFRAGKEAERKATERAVAAAPAPALADRAINKAISTDLFDDDLIQGVETGTVKLDSLKAEELPDALQKLTPEQRRKAVADKIAERKKLRERILELSKKREAFLAEERNKQSAKAPTGFDEAVGSALKAQIGRKGSKP